VTQLLTTRKGAKIPIQNTQKHKTLLCVLFQHPINSPVLHLNNSIRSCSKTASIYVHTHYEKR